MAVSDNEYPGSFILYELF